MKKKSSLIHWLMKKLAPILIIGFLVVQGVISLLPLSAQSPNMDFDAGSLIIPMDTTYQNLGMWKAYGLLYSLLENEIPVAWAIEDEKSFNGIDFSATSKDLRTNVSYSSHAYTGGPFVIASENVSRAIPVIQAFWARSGNLPNVHQALEPFNVNVDLILRRAPIIANEATNAGIAINYYNTAMIPDLNGRPWSSASPNILNQTKIANGALFEAGPCSQKAFDLFVTPHNGGYSYSLTDPNNLGTRTYAELDYFVYQGGGWIAMCHSILSNENAIANLYRNSNPAVRSLFKSEVNGGFLTTTGFTTIANRGGVWTVERPELPFAQAVATAPNVVQSLPGGSVQTWNRNSVTYYSQTEKVAHFRDAAGNIFDWAITGVAHDDAMGKITFIGGHSYSTSLPYTSNMEAPYLRFFYNSLFFNSVGTARLDVELSKIDIPKNQPSTLTIKLNNVGASIAKNTSNVAFTLSPNVEYLGMISGPTPNLSGLVSTGQTLTWNSALGDIAGNSTALEVQVRVNPSSLGYLSIVDFYGKYGDVFGEQFTAKLCRTVTVYDGPNPIISKTPDERTYYPGQVANWTLSYRNTGGMDLLNTYIDDYLPEGFSLRSASIQPLSIVPQLDGTTRIRWNVGTLPSGGALQEILITAYITQEIDTHTNLARITGYDSKQNFYQAEDTANANIILPPISLTKSVDPGGSIDVTNPGQVLTYKLRPYYGGGNLLENVLISDAIPQFTTYVSGSASHGGSYNYTPLPAANGVWEIDAINQEKVSVSLAITTANSDAVMIGAVVNVAMTVTNSTGGAISTVIPNVYERLNGATLSTPSTLATLANNASHTFNFSTTLTDIGERLFLGNVEYTIATDNYTSSDARSRTILVLSHLNSTPNEDLVTWRLGGNDPGASGESLISGFVSGVYAFRGANNREFSKYSLSSNSWITRSQPTNGIEKGGSLTYAGNGIIYASEGNSKWFYKYEIEANTWTRMSDVSDNFSEGGGIQYLEVNGVKYVYSVLGNSKRFRRYNIATNNWTTLQDLPENIKQGGAITTDGTHLYVLRGDGKKDFYKYDIAANSWSSLALTPENVKWGGSLEFVNGNIYAFRGDGKTNFWRYNISSNTWTSMANAPGNVGDGGSLTTDGTYLYALQGKTRNFWRYTISTNTWSVLPAVNFTGNVGQGGSLVYAPGVNPQGYFTSISTNAALITSGDTLTVTMDISASMVVNNVLAGTLNVTSTNGASYSSLVGPTLISADNNISNSNDLVQYQWTLTGITNTLLNSKLTFSVNATGNAGAVTFPLTTSRSVLISPELSFQVKVFDAGVLPESVNQIVNVGMISDQNALMFGVNSNPTTNALLQPRLTLRKFNTPQGEVVPGQEITYTVNLKNEGLGSAYSILVEDVIPDYSTYVPNSATINGVSGVSIDQSLNDGSLKFMIDLLQFDEEVTMTFKVKTPLIMAAGQYAIENEATATATNVSGTITSNKVVNIVTFAPSMTILKFSEEDLITMAGEVINYTIVIGNDGNIPLTNIEVDDPMLENIIYVSGDENNNNILDVNELWVYTGTYTITQDDLDGASDYVDYDGEHYHLINTASATSNEIGPVYAEFEIEIDVTPELTLEKISDVLTYNYVGDQIEYTFIITNTGNVTLMDVILFDGLFDPSNIPLEPSPLTLEPGESITVNKIYTVTLDDVLSKSILNVATASAFTPRGDEIDDSDSVEVTLEVIKAQIRIKKNVINKPVNLDEEFMIAISSEDFQTSVVLKHDEISYYILVDADVENGTTYEISEILPMQFEFVDIKIVENTISGTTRPSKEGNQITVWPGNDITIEVENRYIKSGFFKAIDSIFNFFSRP